MIPNPYYLGNPPLTFSNTPRPMPYSFLDMVSTGITKTRRSHGVQASVVTPLVTIHVGGFFIENMMPFFQLPTQNPPSRFNNSGGGIPMGGSGSPLHGSGGPPRGGPLGGGGGPPCGGRPPSGGGPPSVEGPPEEDGGEFPVGGTSVPFGAP